MAPGLFQRASGRAVCRDLEVLDPPPGFDRMEAMSSNYLDLYHRTTAEAAREILTSGSMRSKEASQDAFFSTHPDSPSMLGYGPVAVHVRVPGEWVDRGWAILEDEFELDDGSWEEHYVVNVARLQPEHFIEAMGLSDSLPS